ncbi:Hypothetical predicted protein [Lecanosticta acicola]|uniref:Mitochondrial import inner membrane translocase subunit TIM54 n=1 Tax=Lecanosticta acicola TaxID=111012 RepID=A0AAI8Z5I7_9PEZI|nr:Hypothetical predicted protein [Lecanosticta acicola]
MSGKTNGPPADNAAPASSNASASSAGSANASGATSQKPQNPAFRMMGLPRLRLPSRNWMIFLSVTGSFAGAVIYDKWQTKRMREKWCSMVSHIADQPLDTKTAPRKVTIYLCAPPGDGLRSAREHFHEYVKPVLVSAAMDWDVVEGRKEGDVRHKTAERIRKRRRLEGEGPATAEEDAEEYTVESIRAKNGDVDFPGVAGDIVIGRHTWKEYIRGIHEGYLGPVDAPKSLAEGDASDQSEPIKHASGQPSVGDAAVNAATETAIQDAHASPVESLESAVSGNASATDDHGPEKASPEVQSDTEKKEKEVEKPKRRFPPPYVSPDEYDTAALSPSTPEIIGPSVGVRMPHLLGFRNTPIRIYRFLNRRRLQDDVGRQVAAAVLAAHRPYGSVAVTNDDSATESIVDVPEQQGVLAFEEKDWWSKVVNRQREEHEESVWIEPIALDERIASRMRAFYLTSEDEDRAKRMENGTEKAALKRGDRSRPTE